MTQSNWKIVIAITIASAAIVSPQFDWQTRDAFDEIQKQLKKVTSENCKIVDINDLYLPSSAVTHVPDLKWLGIDPIFPNRTNLLHIHNVALSRAFYFR